MPTYDYQCRSCGIITEVVHSMLDDGPTTCERCGGELRRVFHPTGIIFKGGGFYKTDSRSSSAGSAGGSGRSSSSGSGDGSAPASSSTEKSTGDKGSEGDKGSAGDKGPARDKRSASSAAGDVGKGSGGGD